MSELAESTTHSEPESTASTPRQASPSPPQSPASPQSSTSNKSTEEIIVRVVNASRSNLTEDSSHNQDESERVFFKIDPTPENPRTASDSIFFRESKLKSKVPKDIEYTRGQSAVTLDSINLVGLSSKQKKYLEKWSHMTNEAIESKITKDLSGYSTSDHDGSDLNYLLHKQESNESNETPDPLNPPQGVSIPSGYLYDQNELHQIPASTHFLYSSSEFSINATEYSTEDFEDDADNKKSVKKKIV